MPDDGYRSHRSARERMVRPILAGMAVLLGLFVISFAYAHVVAKRDISLAYRLAPYDSRIAAKYASTLVQSEPTAEKRQRAERLARQALVKDATAVDAVTAVGLGADARQDAAARDKAFAFAQQLSRRNFTTQMWAIEHAVGSGNVPSVLHQYDVTLRVFPNAGDMLFPILLAASKDKAINAELLRTLGRQPAWIGKFVTFAANKGDDAVQSARIFMALRRMGVTIPSIEQANIVNTLIEKRQYDAAWSYYASLRSGAQRDRSRDPHFSETIASPSRLDWLPSSEGGISTTIGSGVADFSAAASVSGNALTQWQLLPPGRYLVSGTSSGINPSDPAVPYWVVACANGSELGRISLPRSGDQKVRFTGIVQVPAGCTIQRLSLVIQPSEKIAGVVGQIFEVVLSPQ